MTVAHLLFKKLQILELLGNFFPRNKTVKSSPALRCIFVQLSVVIEYADCLVIGRTTLTNSRTYQA